VQRERKFGIGSPGLWTKQARARRSAFRLSAWLGRMPHEAPPLDRRVLLLALMGALARAGEESPAQPWPLWDGKETIAEYARRAKLPRRRHWTWVRGELELVLIPAGKFIMGWQVPEPLWIGQGITIAGAVIMLALFVATVLGMIRRRSWRPQFSLVWLVALTIAPALPPTARAVVASILGLEDLQVVRRQAQGSLQERRRLTKSRLRSPSTWATRGDTRAVREDHGRQPSYFRGADYL